MKTVYNNWVNSITHRGLEFIFDKAFMLIWILNNWEVLNETIKAELDDKFIWYDLYKYLENEEVNPDYKEKFNEWMEFHNNFIF